MTQIFGRAIILLIFLFSFVAHAEKSPPESPYLTDEPKVATDTSAFNRKNKTVSFYAETTAGTHFGGTFNASYFIKPDLQIMLEFSRYGSLSGVYENISQVPVFYNGFQQTDSNDGVGLHLKYFMGNSIFLRLGFSHNVIHYNRKYNTTLHESYINGEVDYFVGGFGNDWQWENFTFGFDWYKVQYPIGSKLNSRQDASEDTMASSKQDELLDSTMSLVGLHLGFSF